MAGSFYSDNSDSMDIKELAALNEDISDDFIEQLQQQLSGNAPSAAVPVNVNDDSTLFEEAQASVQDSETTADNVAVGASEPSKAVEPTAETVKKEEVSVNTNFDDNFIKKYKAKLNKKANLASKADYEALNKTPEAPQEKAEDNVPIENLSQGNISERPLTKDIKSYNESLDFLDGNVKYSKYVIYIDPQNVDFIEGLTVKERKNLINGILRQQDDIAITKQRFKIMQTVIRHVIIAILTVAISIPVVYYTINASLEATIDNHRRSQSNWQTLYREHGKITQQ